MILTPEFLQNVILLVLTGAFTGLLAPYILKKVDERKSRELARLDEDRHQRQKQFEADLARQGKIIDSQALLLDTLSNLVWKFQLNAIDVSYYHINAPSLPDQAATRYEENAGDTLAKIRAEISKSLRLTSRNLYDALIALYYKDLLGADLRLRNLVEGKESDWRDFNSYMVHKLPAKVDGVLDQLACELRLKPGNSENSPSEQRLDGAARGSR